MKKVLWLVVAIAVVVGAVWWFTQSPQDVEAGIVQQLAEKYDKDVSAVEVAVNDQRDAHLSGQVCFTDGPTPQGACGLFFAALVDGDWKLVWDGNGLPECSLIEPYDFPEDMLGCF